MEKCAAFLIKEPGELCGKWLERFPGHTQLHLELGCGKGRFTADTAEKMPGTLLLAVEKVADAMIIAMERVRNREIENVRFINGDAAGLLDMFAPSEVDRIYINFCDPWPKSRDAKFRLTSPGFLRLYADVLKSGGQIHFKTDNTPLFDWSTEQFRQEGWQLSELTHDLHKAGPVGVMTDYEAKFYAKGLKINRLVAEKTGGASKSSRRDIKHEDTTCVMKVTAEPENVEQYGFGIEFNYPIIYENFDSLTLTATDPKQRDTRMKFKVERDSLNLRKYVLRPEGKLMSGYEYKLKVPYRKFRDINGFYNDSTEVKVSLPKDEKLSSLTLNLTGVNNKYIIDLLNEKRDKVLRSYVIEKDAALLFPYLKEGKYSIRITEDLNRNGIVDTGNLLEHRQPEKVRFYKLRDGSFLITIKESTEMEQKIDVAKLFDN